MIFLPHDRHGHHDRRGRHRDRHGHHDHRDRHAPHLHAEFQFQSQKCLLLNPK